MDITTLYAIFLVHPFISTDTRSIKPGSIFFALKGDKFDGNTFAKQALEQGAAFSVVSDPALRGAQLVHVDDTLKTLQSLANYHRHQLKIPVLAITGSNGKTTTKELIAAVLSTKYKVHATAGNLNNHIGVPLTILGVGTSIEFIVCEMGANHAGEIAQLCTIAEPTYGLITNIGKAHLEGFGSIEGVKKAKGELFAYLQKHHHLGFVNTDDPRLLELGETLDQKVTYGFNPDAHPQINFSYSVTPGVAGFTLKDNHSPFVFHSSMFGQYNATNMLAAYAVGNHFQVNEKAIAATLSRFVPGANRSEIISHHGCTIVKDAYNANPSSMELAVRAFSEQHANGWLVLGDMKELGYESNKAHLKMIHLISALDFDRIYIVGKAFSAAYLASGMNDGRFIPADDILTLKSIWRWDECRGKALLLKGSRSMQLELLLET